jgi:hypothetical protein
VKYFISVPCCFPTCNSVTYAYVDGDTVSPLPRVLDVDEYLDYITNRVLPDLGNEIGTAVEAQSIWPSATAVMSWEWITARYWLPRQRKPRRQQDWLAGCSSGAAMSKDERREWISQNQDILRFQYEPFNWGLSSAKFLSY